MKNIFDHDLPDYNTNGRLIRYTGVDLLTWPTSGTKCGNEALTTGQMGYGGHNGYDFMWRGGGISPCNTTGASYSNNRGLVFAAYTGYVTKVGWRWSNRNKAYGFSLDLDHTESADVRTLYGHMASIVVREGDTINEGALIGSVGDTGSSDGLHLHFTAAHGDPQSTSPPVFDPFGWNAIETGAGYAPPMLTPTPSGSATPFPDPWGTPSSRRMLPNVNGSACVSYCSSGDHWVTDSGGTQFSCTPDSPGCAWTREPAGRNQRGAFHKVRSTGNGNETAWVVYTCGACSAGGVYDVYAYVPIFGGEAADVARYTLGSRLTGLVQSELRHQARRIIIGRTNGVPQVRLSNRGDYYGSGGGALSTQYVLADDLWFRKSCTDGAATPEAIER